MLSVPSVTMNAGNRRAVTSPPFRIPKPTHVRIPSAIAGSAGTPFATASFVITIWPSAITVPHERSMPAVRITSVWPIASTPVTITCCSTSERFWPCRNWPDLALKNAIARSRATSGPIVEIPARERASPRARADRAAERAVVVIWISVVAMWVGAPAAPGRLGRPGA